MPVEAPSEVQVETLGVDSTVCTSYPPIVENRGILARNSLRGRKLRVRPLRAVCYDGGRVCERASAHMRIGRPPNARAPSGAVPYDARGRYNPPTGGGPMAGQGRSQNALGHRLQ